MKQEDVSPLANDKTACLDVGSLDDGKRTHFASYNLLILFVCIQRKNNTPLQNTTACLIFFKGKTGTEKQVTLRSLPWAILGSFVNALLLWRGPVGA